MKHSKKSPSSMGLQFLVALFVIIAIASVEYTLFSSRFTHIKTIEELSVQLNSVRRLITKLGYTLDIVVTAQRFEQTTANFLIRDAAQIEGKIKTLMADPGYRKFFKHNKPAAEEFSSFPKDWQRIAGDIESLGRATTMDEVILIHNDVDVDVIRINEKFDKIFTFITMDRVSILTETKVLLLESIGLFVFLFLVSAFIFYRRVVVPLRGITETTQAISSGAGDLRFKGSYRGLAGVLAGELNKMLDAFKDKFILKDKMSDELLLALEKKDSEIVALNQIAACAGKSLSTNDLLKLAVKSAAAASAADGVCIFVVEGGELTLRASSDFDAIFVKGAAVLPGTAHGETMKRESITEYKTPDEFPYESYGKLLTSCGITALLCVKISAGNEVYGYLHAAFKEGRAIENTGFFKALVTNIETFIGHIRLFQEEHGVKKFIEGTVKQLPFGIAVFDHEGKCLLSNDMLKRLLGARPDFDFITNYRFQDDEFFNTEGLTETIEKSYEGFMTEFIVNYNPALVKRYGFLGEPRKLKIRSLPLYDSNGEISGITLVSETVATTDEPTSAPDRKV